MLNPLCTCVDRTSMGEAADEGLDGVRDGARDFIAHVDAGVLGLYGTARFAAWLPALRLDLPAARRLRGLLGQGRLCAVPVRAEGRGRRDPRDARAERVGTVRARPTAAAGEARVYGAGRGAGGGVGGGSGGPSRNDSSSSGVTRRI